MSPAVSSACRARGIACAPDRGSSHRGDRQRSLVEFSNLAKYSDSPARAVGAWQRRGRTDQRARRELIHRLPGTSRPRRMGAIASRALYRGPDARRVHGSSAGMKHGRVQCQPVQAPRSGFRFKFRFRFRFGSDSDVRRRADCRERQSEAECANRRQCTRRGRTYKVSPQTTPLRLLAEIDRRGGCRRARPLLSVVRPGTTTDTDTVVGPRTSRAGRGRGGGAEEGACRRRAQGARDAAPPTWRVR